MLLIEYAKIQRGFLLPSTSGKEFFLVLKISPPLRQGARTFDFITAQLNREEQVSVELNLDAEQQAKYSELQSTMHGSQAETICTVVAQLMGKSLTSPTTFKSAHVAYVEEVYVVDEEKAKQREKDGTAGDDDSLPKKLVRSEKRPAAVRTHHKGVAGHLYPLEHAFMFIHKPPVKKFFFIFIFF